MQTCILHPLYRFMYYHDNSVALKAPIRNPQAAHLP